MVVLLRHRERLPLLRRLLQRRVHPLPLPVAAAAVGGLWQEKGKSRLVLVEEEEKRVLLAVVVAGMVVYLRDLVLLLALLRMVLITVLLVEMEMEMETVTYIDKGDGDYCCLVSGRIRILLRLLIEGEDRLRLE